MRIDSIEVTNYVGAGEEPIRVETGRSHAVLCGPNGSGKTTLLSSVEVVRQLFSLLSPIVGHHRQWVDVVEWADTRPHVTADLFHRKATEAKFRLMFAAPETLEDVLAVTEIVREQKSLCEMEESDREMAHFLPDSPMTASDNCVEVGLSVSIRNDQKFSLDSFSVGGTEVFRKGKPTPLLSLAEQQPVNAIRYEFCARENQRLQENTGRLFALPRVLTERILYVPSRRDATLGPHSDLKIMASGRGLTSWILAAANPNPRDTESTRRHELLQSFQDEFADFAQLKRVTLSVPELADPVQPGESPEINVTIDGRVLPVSRLGAGIAAALIILLLCKLSQELEPPIDVVLLEEPELHLHPSLQRRLVERLVGYGVQLIASTHSPTIIDALIRQGASVFRTRYEDSAQRIAVQPVTRTGEARLLLEAIGSSPADLLLADKVLWVEGPTDIPVFRDWIAKAQSFRGQNVSVISIGGDDAASRHFDVSHLSNLHPKMWAVLDSERKQRNSSPESQRLKIKEKLEANGIPCHLTERRATESYFTLRALNVIYSKCPAELDPYGDPDLANQGVEQFDKHRNGEVAEAMEWQELERTDLADFIKKFLAS